jgi:hypothetical protein
LSLWRCTSTSQQEHHYENAESTTPGHGKRHYRADLLVFRGSAAHDHVLPKQRSVDVDEYCRHQWIHGAMGSNSDRALVIQLACLGFNYFYRLTDHRLGSDVLPGGAGVLRGVNARIVDGFFPDE